MKSAIRNLAAAFALFATLTSGAFARDFHVTARGRWLASELDRMNVESKWIAGARVNWRTGLPVGEGEPLPGRHTHCSAFVAAAAEMLGVYILRPPEHRQTLLANAQNEWLAEEGSAEGWRPLDGPMEAQAAANRGRLVVAGYHNRRDDKPGHIAIVRPGSKSAGDIEAEGPDVIQAGTINSSSISVKAGFAGHVHAWNDDEIEYYVHEITAMERPAR
jgi:hypothetical protein